MESNIGKGDEEKNNKPKILGDDDSDDRSETLFFYFSVFTANLMPFACGSCFSWTSPVLPKLKESDPDINPLGEVITASYESLLFGLLSLGAAIGPIFAGKLADSFGRKKSLLLTVLPVLLSYALMIVFPNIKLFCFARFIIGICAGCASPICPMYLAEITEVRNRGKFGCFLNIFFSLGILYPFIVGPFLTVMLLNVACAVPILLFVILFGLFIPESPTFLVYSGNIDAAEKALIKLRNKNSNIQKELEIITKDVQQSSEKEKILNIFKKKNLRKGIIITVGLLLLQQFSGINVIFAYLEPIFVASGTGISTYNSLIFINIIQVLANILAALLVEKVGRRCLLLISSIGTSFPLIAFGIYFHLQNSKFYDTKYVFWFPLVCMVVYTITYNLGIGPLPWVALGEFFPINAAATASSFATFCYFSSGFLVSLCFSLILEQISMAFCFWLFGICCILGTIFVYYSVPETKGKSTEEIQKILNED